VVNGKQILLLLGPKMVALCQTNGVYVEYALSGIGEVLQYNITSTYLKKFCELGVRI